MMWKPLGLTGSSILAVASLFCHMGAAADPPRPNIVVILSDDMGFSDIGCYGGEIQTPNLDGLAAGGLKFTQFYNTARCCPTRASLLTGLYPHQAGLGHMMEDKGLDAYRGNLNRQCVTIAEALKPAGYRTYAVGKWHVTRHTAADGPKHNWPLSRGFDRYYGTIHGAGSFYDPSSLVRDNTMISAFADPEYKPEGTYYYTDAIADHAVRFIGEHDSQHAQQPLFMYVAFTAAHWPMHALPEDIARYKGKYDVGYEPIRKLRLEKAAQLGLVDATQGMTPTAEDWDAVPDKAWEAAGMEVYAAMIDRMDQGIGKIVAELKRTGRLDNTLILYLQDNGGCAEPMGRAGNPRHPNILRPDMPTLPPLDPKAFITAGSVPDQTRDGYPVRMGRKVMPGPADTYVGYGRGWANVSNTPLREFKHWVHEGGISTPLIAHWPARIKDTGKLRTTPGHLVDIMATCLDVAGATYPAEYAGEKITPAAGTSLVPVFDDKPLDREAIYWEHEGNRAIRIGKWKLVAKGPGAPWELYDISTDRTELNDLAAKHPERVKDMTARWDAWAKHSGVLPWIWNPPYRIAGVPLPPGVIIDYHPTASKQYIGSPSIAVLPNGDYVASHDFFGPGSTRDVTVVFGSSDRGQSWQRRAEINGQWWSTLFVHRGSLYILGTSAEYGFTVIRKSDDGGRTWTEPQDDKSGLLLGDGKYHCAPVPVVQHNGRLWRAMEDAMGDGGWGSHFRSFMMSVPETADLLVAANWTFSNRLPRDPQWLDKQFGGWLEGNAVVTPEGKIVNILRADSRNPEEKAAIVTVSDDGKEQSFDPATGFIPFPGGAKKFSIRYDPESKRYWTLCNWVPPEKRNDRPAQTRNTLALFSSPDLKQWDLRRVILSHEDRIHHGFQYVDWLFEGDDLIAVVRTAFDEPDGTQAHNQHDANYLTFHRLEKFREP
jgi:arylsulfatase A-like enzyme